MPPLDGNGQIRESDRHYCNPGSENGQKYHRPADIGEFSAAEDRAFFVVRSVVVIMGGKVSG